MAQLTRLSPIVLSILLNVFKEKGFKVELYLWGSCVENLSNWGTEMRPHGMWWLGYGTLDRTN